jgi:hypothetical protein
MNDATLLDFLPLTGHILLNPAPTIHIYYLTAVPGQSNTRKTSPSLHPRPYRVSFISFSAPPTHPNTAIMSYNVLMQLYRKEGTNPEQFKTYYETIHVPIIQRLSGDLFPTLHSRHYIGYVPQATSTASKSHPAPDTEADTTDGGGDERVKAAVKLLSGSASAGDSVPMVVQGQPHDFGWDVCTVLRFGSQQHFQAFMGVLMNAENARVLAEDEEKFMDRSKFKCVILGETLKTVNEKWEEGTEKSG